ncbi:hypothetical protein ACHAWF_000594 [Thalassiosira exigua]
MTRSTTIGILLLSASVHGFNIISYHSGRRRPRNTMPPLYYTDVEPEIRSVTVPLIVDFNTTSILVEPAAGGSLGASSTALAPESKAPLQPASKPAASNKSAQAAADGKSKPTRSHKVTWQTRYNQLVQYNAEHGHCRVPQSYGANPKLGLWVMQQRRQYTLQQKGKSSSFNGQGGKKRVELLDDIGFVWRVERRGPRGAYGTLRRMKEGAGRTASSGDDVVNVANFEEYLIRKSGDYTDDQIRDAWRQRFEIFR